MIFVDDRLLERSTKVVGVLKVRATYSDRQARTYVQSTYQAQKIPFVQDPKRYWVANLGQTRDSFFHIYYFIQVVESWGNPAISIALVSTVIN